MSTTPATIPPRFKVGDRIYRVWRGQERLDLSAWQDSCPESCEMYVVARVTAKQVWAQSVFSGICPGEDRDFVLSREKLERCGYAFGRDYTLFFVSMPERYRKLTLGFIRQTGPRQVLGLDERFSAEELKRAYRERVLKTHPDRGGTSEAFREVQAAYEALQGSES